MPSTVVQSKQHIFCCANALNLLLFVPCQKHITSRTSLGNGIVASCIGHPANKPMYISPYIKACNWE